MKKYLLFLFFLIPGVASAAAPTVSFHQADSCGSGLTCVVTFTNSSSNPNTDLYVGFTIFNTGDPVVSVDDNGSGLSRLGDIAGTAAGIHIFLYHIVHPPTGSNTITITFASLQSAQVRSVIYDDSAGAGTVNTAYGNSLSSQSLTSTVSYANSAIIRVGGDSLCGGTLHAQGGGTDIDATSCMGSFNFDGFSSSGSQTTQIGFTSGTAAIYSVQAEVTGNGTSPTTTPTTTPATTTESVNTDNQTLFYGIILFYIAMLIPMWFFRSNRK